MVIFFSGSFFLPYSLDSPLSSTAINSVHQTQNLENLFFYYIFNNILQFLFFLCFFLFILVLIFSKKPNHFYGQTQTKTTTTTSTTERETN